MTINANSNVLKTEFKLAAINVGKYVFWLDGNSKITCEDGTTADPAANAFSVLPVTDCPFSTPTCRAACYVGNLMQAKPMVAEAYRRNSEELASMLLNESPRSLFQLAREFARAISHLTRFRWHVSGDITCDAHAQFIADVCMAAPNVAFWIYTRSFPFAHRLAAIDNLSLNLSADMDNHSAAVAFKYTYGGRLCWMTPDDGYVPDLPPGSIIFPTYGLRDKTPNGKLWFKQLTPAHKKMVCPVDRLGATEKRRCGNCKMCL